jgi:hypothetical protein
MVDKKDGGTRGAGEATQAVQNAGHLSSGVLVGAMEADEWIQQEQAWLSSHECGGQAVKAIRQPDGRLDNDVEGEIGQRAAPRSREGTEPRDHNGVRILCTQEDHRTWNCDGEMASAGSAGSDGHAKVQSKEALATLGRAPKDPGAAAEEEALDEPGNGGRLVGELRRRDRGVGLYGRGHQACSRSKAALSTS